MSTSDMSNERITDYTPIACGEYSRLEVAIDHRDMLDIRWNDDQGQTRQTRARALDLTTVRGAEFLLLDQQGLEGDGAEQIRLDFILQFQPA